MITSSNEEGYSNYQYQPYNYGWNTTSQDYHAHVSSMERSPSVVADFPRYPNFHKIFNNNYEDKTPPRINQQQHHAPQAHKKVRFVEQDKTTQVVKAADDNNKNGKNVSGDCIDAKADGFIKQKHQKFELAKWETFKSL